MQADYLYSMLIQHVAGHSNTFMLLIEIFTSCCIVPDGLLLAAMLHMLCQHLAVYGWEDVDHHTAVLRTSNLHACLPHIHDILASISALATTWVKARMEALLAASASKSADVNSDARQDQYAASNPGTLLAGGGAGFAGCSRGLLSVDGAALCSWLSCHRQTCDVLQIWA
jgi:hypothetical protein